MSDVIGRAIVTISPDFTGFRPRVSSEMERVAAEAGKRFNKTFTSSLKGLKPALEEVVQQVKAVDTAVSKIDTRGLTDLTSAARIAGSAISGVVDEVRLLNSALNAIDPSNLRALARGAGLADDSLEGTTRAAAATDAALASIDTKDLAEVASAAVKARTSLDGTTGAAAATDAALGAIDPTDLFEVSGAAQAASSALEGTAAAAFATDGALATIDAGDLSGVVSAAGLAASALDSTAGAALSTDAALATIDAGDISGVAAAAATATGAVGGLGAASAVAAAQARDAGGKFRGMGGDADGTRTSFNNASAAAAGLSGELSGLKTVAGFGALALGGLAVAGVKIAGDLEQAQIAFTGLLGSQEEADAFLGTLKEFASVTPFEFEQVLPATQKLIALGQTGDEAIATLTTVGNAAAAVGASGASIDGVVTAIAQIQAKGKLSAQELNQIAERLPNFNRGDFLDKLAVSLNVTGEEVRRMAESGDILSGEAIPVLLQALDDVPGAMGAMERQSVSLKGRLSTLSDNVKFGLADAFTGLGNQISPSLEPLGKSLNTALKDVGSGVAEIASRVLPVIIPMIDQLGPVLSNALRGLALVLGPLIAGFAVFVRVIAPVAQIIAPIVAGVAALVAVIMALNKIMVIADVVMKLVKVTLVGQTGILAKLSRAWALMGAAVSKALTLIAAHPFVAVAAVIAGLFFLMWRNSEKLRTAVGNLGRVIMVALGPAIEFVRNVLGSLLGVEFADFGSILESLGDKLAVFVQFLAERLLMAFAAIADVFSTHVMPVLSAVSDLVGAVVSAVGGAVGDLLPLLSTVGDSIGEALGSASQGVSSLSAVLTVIGGFFGNVVEQAGNLWAVLTSGREVAEGVGEVLDNVLGNSGSLIDPIASVTDSLIGLWQTVKDLGEVLFAVNVQPLLDAFGALSALVNGDFSGALDIGKTALGGFAEAVLDLPAALFGLISGLANSAGVIVEEGRAIAARFLSGLLAGVIEVPFVGPMVAALKAGVDAVLQSLGGYFDIIGGIFTWDGARIAAGVSAVLEAFKTQFTVAIPNLLSGLTDLFSDILPPILTSMVESVRDIPILGDIATFVLEAIKGGFQALGGLGDVLGGLLTFDADRILTGLTGVATGIATWISELPGAVFGLIADTTGVVALVGEWVAGWFSGLAESVRDIPILGDLAALVLDPISGAFAAVGGLGDTIAGLFTLDFDRVADGLGGIIGAIGDFLINLPSAILGYVGDLGALLGTLISGAAEWIADNAPALFSALQDLPEIIGNVVVAAFSGIGDLLGSLFGSIFGGEVDEAAKGGAKSGSASAPAEKDNPIVGLFKSLFEGAKNWITNNAIPTIGGAIASFVSRLPSILGNIFGGLVSIVATIVPGLLGLFVDWLSDLGGLLLTVLTGAFNFIVDNGPGVLAAVGRWLVGLPGVLLGFLGDLGGMLFGWMSAAWDRLSENAGPMLSKLGSWLASVPGMLIGFLGDWYGLLLDAIGGAFSWVVENGPGLLGDLLGWIASLPIQMLGALANLGITLLEWFANGIYWVVTEGPGAVADLLAWVAGIPGQIISGLGALGSLLSGWAQDAFRSIVDNGADILSAVLGWVTGIPGQMIGGLAALGQQLWDWARAAFEWIVTNGADILAATITWATGVPGKIISAMAALGSQLWNWAKAGFGWIVSNGADILSAVGTWAASVPGKIIGFLGDLRTKVVDWAKGAFNAVRDRGPEVISGVIEFFKSIPSRLFNALKDGIGAVGGVATDIGGRIWNAVKSSLDSALDSIRERKITVGPVTFTPFSVLPDLMAEGGIVTRATQAIIGEAGPEVVIPLTDPQRAKELVVQSGLLNIIQETPTSISAAAVGGITLPVPAAPGVSAPTGATLEVPAVNVPAGLAVSAPPATVDTAPVAAAASNAMTAVVASATGALAPLTNWFATFPAIAAASLVTFGPTVWTAAQPSFAFFVNSALTELDRLVAYMMAFTPLVISILTPFGPTLWAAMAPGLAVLRSSVEGLFDNLATFVTTWQDNVRSGLAGLPAWAGGIGTQIVNALASPFKTFASATWNPFVVAMNAALDQIPATAAINIPLLPTAHSGGVIGDQLPETGGPLSASEMVVKMKRGEGVLPTDAMSKLAPAEFEALRSGNVDRLATRVFGERDPRKDETGDGVPYSPTPAERGFSLTPDTVIAAMDGVIAGLRGNVAALNADPTYTAKFLGGTTDRAMTEGSKFVGAKVNEANAAALNSIGGVGTAFPTGVPAALGPAIEMMRAWKGRAGSSQAILRYFAATGVPGRATSIFRPGAVTRGSGGRRASLHSQNRAVDFAGPQPGRDSPELLRIYNAFAPVAGILSERIYSGPGGGFVRNPITRADHHDHVHVGLADGAVLRGVVDALIGEAGPEVRVPLSDVGGLSGFLRGSAISAPVIDTPTFATLGVVPEVVLPLSRPERARDLARQALAVTGPGRQALMQMGATGLPAPRGFSAPSMSGLARYADGGMLGNFDSPALERPRRNLTIADQSSLLEVLEATQQQNATTRTVEAPGTPGTQVPFDGGPLGGGPGNTYHITGISLDQVIAEIEARDEATLRKRR